MVHALTVVAFILPLGLDTFALSAALDVAGLSSNERLRASLILTGFEAVRPWFASVTKQRSSRRGRYSSQRWSTRCEALSSTKVDIRQIRDQCLGRHIEEETQDGKPRT